MPSLPLYQTIVSSITGVSSIRISLSASARWPNRLSTSRSAIRNIINYAATISNTIRNIHHETSSHTSADPRITLADREHTDSTSSSTTERDHLKLSGARSSQSGATGGSHGRIGLRRHRRHSQAVVVKGGPSASLIAALQESGHYYAVPAVASRKVDLSHVSPMALSIHKKINPSGGTATATIREASKPLRKSLQTLLGQYIRLVDPILRQSSSSSKLESTNSDLDQALCKILDEEALALLSSKGYEFTDLLAWAWVLTTESSEKAAARLMALANSRPKGSETVASSVPTFLFLFLLRRKHINSRALRILIIHAWDRLQGRRSQQWAVDLAAPLTSAVGPDWSMKSWKRPFPGPRYYQTMSETTIMIMVIRLLRHTRQVWPAAIMSVAAMLTKHVDGLSEARGPESTHAPSERIQARLTFLYNKVLSLLAIPSSLNPFRSVPYHQRAQFSLLRRMNEFEPALAINREGYRAVARVQLAHKKTLRERDWAELKARSWPPWKEEKLGMDADKGVEYGTSRAQESLLRLKEAGYSMQAWDHTAGIFAGWDTDRSPTIQTRILLQKPSVSHRARALDTAPSKKSALWAARIRATRTLDEAWACFLTWMDCKFPHSESVYYAMFEKLVFDKKRRRSEGNSKVNNAIKSDVFHRPELPGDGKEVLAVPTSPREAVYLRTSPPSIDALFNTMVQNGVKPSGRCLAFLISHADSLGAGMKYLRASNLPPATVRGLVNRHSTNSADVLKQLEAIPHYLFAAFVKLLSRFTTPISPGCVQTTEELLSTTVNQDSPRIIVSRRHARRTSPLVHAFNVMSARKPFYRPPWYSLLSSLARPGVVVDTSTHRHDSDIQDMLSWQVVLQLLHQMRNIGLDLDFQGFHIVCTAFEKALFRGLKVLEAIRTEAKFLVAEPYLNVVASPEGVDPSLRLRVDAEQVVNYGLEPIKSLFKELVRVQTSNEMSTSTASAQQPDVVDPAMLLPQLMDVPAPAQLHAFVRVLGIRQDYGGILDLVCWMARFAPELQAVAEEARNGPTLMRRTLVAVRVFTERSWLYVSAGKDDDAKVESSMEEDSTSKVVMQQIYEVVENTEAWGGWPTDEEVYAYCKRGRFS